MSQKKKHSVSPKHQQQLSPTGRQLRKDRGGIRMKPRDRVALTWIAQQYAMHIEHIHLLLRQFPAQNGTHQIPLSKSSTYDIIRRWKQAAWVTVERGHDNEPMWVSLTKKGLTALSLSYQYHDLQAESTRDRKHLSAITEVRLSCEFMVQGLHWTSERTLLQGTRRRPGRELMHRPDAVLSSGTAHIAIEVELSRKTPSLLSHILVTLLREGDYQGQAYHDLKASRGAEAAQAQLPDAWHHYAQVWYFAPPSIRNHLRRVLATLVQQGHLSDEEAECVQILWYPLPITTEEVEQQQREKNAPVEPYRSEYRIREQGWGERDE